jgi:hypothetical protein
VGALMPASDFQTLLVLSTPLGIPLYSARGLKQTLTPIAAAAANIQRDINGTLMDIADVGDKSFQKYASHIECGDSDTRSSLALDAIWPGQLVTVDCVAELITKTTPARTFVPGSEWTDAGGFLHYRPRLNMMVMNFSSQESEWDATVSWSLDLEET